MCIHANHWLPVVGLNVMFRGQYGRVICYLERIISVAGVVVFFVSLTHLLSSIWFDSALGRPSYELQEAYANLEGSDGFVFGLSTLDKWNTSGPLSKLYLLPQMRKAVDLLNEEIAVHGFHDKTSNSSRVPILAFLYEGMRQWEEADLLFDQVLSSDSEHTVAYEVSSGLQPIYKARSEQSISEIMKRWLIRGGSHSDAVSSGLGFFISSILLFSVPLYRYKSVVQKRLIIEGENQSEFVLDNKNLIIRINLFFGSFAMLAIAFLLTVTALRFWGVFSL